MSAKGLRIGLVGPLPPPSGGMANQTRQLARLLEQEGAEVEIVQVNAPYHPSWIGSVRGVRALFRFIPYLLRLWSATGRTQLFHVMANSGWAWHLFAAPAVWIGKLRRIPVVVNYRGGAAEEFFGRSFAWVRPTLRLADRVIVPSGFLQDVFRRFGVVAEIVPNVIDLGRFAQRPRREAEPGSGPHFIVTRNLEPIYDIETALRAFALVRASRPGATITIAGSGPERERLAGIAETLGVAACVNFTGRVDNEHIADLYQQADIFINPSLVDNLPISILEALASGVPVVSTNVGGVPYLVEDRKNALLVAPRDPESMARAALELLDDQDMAQCLVRAGREAAQKYAWACVRPQLIAIYLGLIACAGSNRAAEAK